MACACGKGRTSSAALPKGASFVYDVTLPGETTVTTYGTPLEAKREVRRHGGGTIKRRSVSTGSAA